MGEGTRLFNQSTVMLRDCLRLEKGEELLILWDGTVSQDLVEASEYAALALGARLLLMRFDPPIHRPVREYGLFARSSLMASPPSLPKSVLAAMVAADRTLFAASDSSAFHFSPEVSQAARGCALVRVGYLTTDAALRLLPESTEEVQQLATLTHRVAEAISGTKRVRVTSRAGTDLTLSLGENTAMVVDDGLGGKGKKKSLPAGQVSRIPDDGSAEGVLVIDRSIGGNDYKELPRPVRLEVREGRVVSISGDTDAARLNRFLEEMNDANIYHLTELGVGTNHRCRYTGVVVPSEDTHTLGCVSLALGCDVHLGGKVRAGAHIDMTMHFATLELDGEKMVDDGQLVVLS